MELSLQYLFITGILIIIFGSVIGILPPKFRLKTNAAWLVPTFILFGLTRILEAIGLFEHLPLLDASILILKLVSILCSLEYIRLGCNSNYKKNLSPFIHIPVAIIFSIILSLSQTTALILLALTYFVIKAFSLIVFHSYIKRFNSFTSLQTILFYIFTFVCILIQIVLYFYFKYPEFLTKIPSYTVFKWLAYAEESIIILLTSAMLFARYKFITKNIFENMRYFNPTIPAALCLCALIVGFFGLRNCLVSYNHQIQNLSYTVEKASNNLSKTINERIEFVSTSASIMSHIPSIVSYFQTRTEALFNQVNTFLSSFNATNPNTLCMLIDTNGKVLAASHDFEGLSQYNYAFREYFKQAMSGVSSVTFEKGIFTKVIGFFGASPIKDPQSNKIIGIALVKRNINTEEKLFQDYSPAMLVDANGTILTSGSKRFIGSNLTLQHKKNYAPERITEEMLKDLPGFNKNYLYGVENLNKNLWKIVILRTINENFKQHPHIIITVMVVFAFMATMYWVSRNNEFICDYKAAQQQFKSLFDYAPDSVFIVSTKTNKIVAANRQMEIVFATPAGLVGSDYGEIFAEASKLNEISEFGTGIFRQERKFKKFNGEEFIGEITSSKISFDDEDSWMIILHDISEHKELETRLLAANQIKTRFYANASHELRTPMTAIIGLSELVSNLGVTEQIQKLANLIRTSAKSMLNLINDLLDISNIETGTFSVKNQPFNIRQSVNDTIEILKYGSEFDSDNIKILFSDRIPDIIISDSARITQILTNAIEYAIKSSKPKEKIYLDIGYLPDNTIENGFNLEFSIRGKFNKIDDKNHEKIFDNFIYDNPYATKDLKAGGSFLSINKQIIDLLKGSVAFFSNNEDETSIAISIPVIKLENGSKEHKILFNKKFEINNEPMKFLVADDNEINLFIASSIIKRNGGTVITANNGEEALKIISDNPDTVFSCMLIDIQMPKLDGLETIKAIKSLKSKASCAPIIAVSAFASEQEGLKSKEAGASDYLGKPYYPDDLINILSKNINVATEDDKPKSEESHQKVAAETKKSNPQKLKHIDLEDLKVRLLQNPKDIEKIEEIYSRRYVELIDKIKKCENSDEPKLIIETAHSIKGLVAMLSAKEAADYALEVETMAKNDDLENARKKMPKLSIFLKEIETDLNQIINEMVPNRTKNL